MIYRLSIPDEIREIVRHQSPVAKQKINAAWDAILENPYSGKVLQDQLHGTRSYVIPPFRVIYEIKLQQVRVLAIGLRKTVYDDFTRQLEKSK